MTSTTGRKRSKLRDLLIIIRLFIYCIAIVLVNWSIYLVRRLRACVQYPLATLNAQSKKPQSVACTNGEDLTNYGKLPRRCLQAKNKARSHDQLKKSKERSGSGHKRVTCSYLQPPPVEELIFTRDDVWRAKNDTSSKLTQPQWKLYSGDSVKCNPDMRKTHINRVNCSPISFSREIKQSVPRANSSYVQTIKNRFVSRRNLRWLQRDPHLKPKPNCRCSRSNSVRPRFTTLSQGNTGKEFRASPKIKYPQQDAITKLMKGDHVSDDQLSSQVKSWNESLRTQKLSCDVVSDSVDFSGNNRKLSQATVHHCLTVRVASYYEGNTSGKLMASKEIRFLHPSLLHDLPLNCVNKESLARISPQSAANTNSVAALTKATFNSSTDVDHTQNSESSFGVALKRPVESCFSGYDFCNCIAFPKVRAVVTSTANANTCYADKVAYMEEGERKIDCRAVPGLRDVISQVNGYSSLVHAQQNDSETEVNCSSSSLYPSTKGLTSEVILLESRSKEL